jgi:hypothetical protein
VCEDLVTNIHHRKAGTINPDPEGFKMYQRRQEIKDKQCGRTHALSLGGQQMCFYDSRGAADQSEMNCCGLRFLEQDMT